MSTEAIAIILIIVIIVYLMYNSSSGNSGNQQQQQQMDMGAMPSLSATLAEQFKSPPPTWDDIVQQQSIDPGVMQSHQQYVANVRNYSSGPSFTQIADDNTSPIFTNFLGFYRPTYVPVGTSARQVPDIDTEVLKRNVNPLANPLMLGSCN